MAQGLLMAHVKTQEAELLRWDRDILARIILGVKNSQL